MSKATVYRAKGITLTVWPDGRDCCDELIAMRGDLAEARAKLNQAQARIIALEAELDRSDVKRYALADENSNLRRQLAAHQIAQRTVLPLTLTDRGDAADGYHPGEVEP